MRVLLCLLPLMAILARAQILDDAVEPDLQKLLVRTGAQAAVKSHFGEYHTLGLHADTLAGGSFLPHTPACSAGGCILNARMAGQLVEWFGNYEWSLRYSGSRDGFTNAAFQGLMTNVPTITIVYSRQTAGAAASRGVYVFGGYTSKSWLSADHTKRCADSTRGGAGQSLACNWWNSCTSSANCATYSQCGCCTASGGSDCSTTCTAGACTAANCVCCADNSCEIVCSHVADPTAKLFTLMANGLHAFNKYASSGTNQEIYTCNTYGPAFGASSTTAGSPPYTESSWALKVDITGRTGSVGSYGFTGLNNDNWATGTKTDWYINEIEVYAITSSSPGRSLFANAPKAGTSGGDSAVHLWYRNTITAAGGFDSWNFKLRVVPPSFADTFMYGFSVALDTNTLVVGRRGNRDIFIHDRDKSHCTESGSTGLCADRGSYSAEAWGLVQVLLWPGSSSYGNVWPEASCSLSGCNTQTAPAVYVQEWGCSVSLQASYLVVGAYKSKKGSNDAVGAAFAYERSQNGDFQYAATLSSSTTANSHCGTFLRYSPVCALPCSRRR